MAEQKNKLTDRQLAGEMRKGRQGGSGGKIVEILGLIVLIAGAVFGGSIPVIIVGALIAGLGEWIKTRSRNTAGRLAAEAIVPDIVNAAFENVQPDPSPRLPDPKDTNIPLPKHDHCSAGGYMRGTYQGLPTELCTVRLTDVSEFQREETGLWEKNEQEVYTGQWMLCKLDREFSTWLTVLPRGGLDKLLDSPAIKTENEEFNKRFVLSSDNAQEALCILDPSRMEHILRLADGSFGKFAVNLNSDGRLYIAVHSGHGFFDVGKGREDPEQLRRRFTRELKWFTDMIDVFRSA